MTEKHQYKISDTEKASLAKILLSTYTEEDLSSLYDLAGGWLCESYKKVFVVVLWSVDKKKRVEVLNSWDDCIKKVSNMGPGGNSKYLYQALYHQTNPKVRYEKGAWKGMVLDVSAYMPMSLTFNHLPLSIGKFSGISNEIVNWRLRIGK